MKIGKLIARLQEYPPDMEVNIDLGYGITGPRIELRDLVNDRTLKFEQTILQIRDPNYGHELGYSHLTEKQLKKARLEVLDALQDVNRSAGERGHGVRRFGSRGGNNFGIWTDFGGRDDHCYQTDYDPRIFVGLESDGLIHNASSADGLDKNYIITEAGIKSIPRRSA